MPISALFSFALASTMPSSNLTINPLFTDGCVLQRGVPARVWGTGRAGEQVTVSLDGKIVGTGEVTVDGQWEVFLPAHSAGTGHRIDIGSHASLTLHDVAFGEVWICSGQSNMEYALFNDANHETEIPRSSNPSIRMFNVHKATADTPASTVAGGNWKHANPETSGAFSAVGYYFAKKLQHDLRVPIGMINASWGGTRIEAWTSKPVNLSLGVPERDFVSRLKQAETDPKVNAALVKWKELGSPVGEFDDPGISKAAEGWEADGGTQGWARASAPGEWTTLGIPELANVDGGVWFRKIIDVPASWTDAHCTLNLGPIDDFDTTFVNGIHVGGIARETPSWWTAPRTYTLPKGALRPGRNVITVRIWDLMQGGGLVGKPEDLYLEGPGSNRISLAGEWDFRIESVRPEPFVDDPNQASALFNAMLSPLGKYTVAGAIWYQGEANSANYKGYREQLPALVNDWRNLFQNAKLPFYAVQLAPYQNEGSDKDTYAKLREAQAMLRDRVQFADSVVISDVGDELDIHPSQKGPVGERLALLALAETYGKPIEAQSPRFESASIHGPKVVVRFAHCGRGLVVRGGPCCGKPVPADRIIGFQIAGEDLAWKPAEARFVSGTDVEVSSPAVPHPSYVRFGFTNFCLCNLFSQAGLPVEPFRTDRDD